MKHCAIVVTFKRSGMLKECLEGLRAQTKKLDHVIVVDNHSCDETEKMVRRDFPEFEFRDLGDNLGGAGGFHFGVRWAYEKGFDWIWLMDDDVEPEPDCFEKMLRFKDKSKCIHPTKRYTNGEIFRWQGYFDPQTSISYRKRTETWRDREYTKVNYGCFEGMLIHRDIVRKIGYPDKKFFIVADDLIYGYLASKHTDVLYLRDAEMKKKILPKKEVEFFGIKRPYQTPFYLYFNTRNHFLKRDYLLKTSDGSKTLINLVLFLKGAKLFLETYLFFRTKEHSKMFWSGLTDALNGDFKGQNRFIK